MATLDEARGDLDRAAADRPQVPRRAELPQSVVRAPLPREGELPHAIESVDRDLERAAHTLGRSEWQTAMEVTLPLARNGIVAGLVLAFARALGEFGATLMLAGNIPGRTTTVPLAIYTAVQTGETGDALALVALLTGLSCVVLIVAGRLGARAT